MKRVAVCCGSFACAIFLFVGFVGCNDHSSGSTSKCVATAPNEICPPQEWAEDYAVVLKLRADLSSPELREKVDKLNGMSQRLQNSVPRGFHYDETKKLWDRDTPPAPPPPPPAAVTPPAPVPAKK